MSRINTCRFCGGRAHADYLVRYSTRAYAHPACFVRNKTIQDAAKLSPFEKKKLCDAAWLTAPFKQESEQ